METIALIPARSGSKGFPHKNIARINGRTLIELAVRVGLDCPEIDRVFISTDSEAYEQIARKAGAVSLGLRPNFLASDTAKTIDVVTDFLRQLASPCKYLVLLQPTSPVRHPDDISAMLSILDTQHAEAIVSVEQIDEPHPFKLKKISDSGHIRPFLAGTSSEIPRQSLSKVYRLTGGIYISTCRSIIENKTLLPENTRPYVMTGTANIDSKRDLDIMLGLLQINKIQIYGV